MKKNSLLLCGTCACSLMFHYALSIDIVSIMLIAFCTIFYGCYLFGRRFKMLTCENNVGALFKIQCAVIVVFLIGNLMTFWSIPYFKVISRIGYFGSYILIWYIVSKRLILAVYSKVKKVDYNKDRARDWFCVLRLYMMLLMCIWLQPYYNYSYSAKYSNGQLIYLKEVDGFYKKEIVKDKETYALIYEKIEDVDYSCVTMLDSANDYYSIVKRGDSIFKITYSDYPNIERVDALSE